MSARIPIATFKVDRSTGEVLDQVFTSALAQQPPMTELITWHEVAVEMPDDGETVLGFNAKWSTPCWGVYLDCDCEGECWRRVEGDALFRPSAQIVDDQHEPTHWAKWPFGPTHQLTATVKGGAR